MSISWPCVSCPFRRADFGTWMGSLLGGVWLQCWLARSHDLPIRDQQKQQASPTLAGYSDPLWCARTRTHTQVHSHTVIHTASPIVYLVNLPFSDLCQNYPVWIQSNSDLPRSFLWYTGYFYGRLKPIGRNFETTGVLHLQCNCYPINSPFMSSPII